MQSHLLLIRHFNLIKAVIISTLQVSKTLWHNNKCQWADNIWHNSFSDSLYIVSKDQAGLHLAAVPPGFVLAECPSPFIRDPKAKNGTTDTENAVFCRFGCCMPCPAQDLVNRLYYMKTRLPVISFYFACISFLMKDGLSMASLQPTLFVLYQQLRHSSFWSAIWYFPTKGGEYKKEGLNKNGKLLLTRKCIDTLHC